MRVLLSLAFIRMHETANAEESMKAAVTHTHYCLWELVLVSNAP
jgi:hypothetical protein